MIALRRLVDDQEQSSEIFTSSPCALKKKRGVLKPLTHQFVANVGHLGAVVRRCTNLCNSAAIQLSRAACRSGGRYVHFVIVQELSFRTFVKLLGHRDERCGARVRSGCRHPVCRAETSPSANKTFFQRLACPASAIQAEAMP
jgi:hypothetical protein